MTDSLAEKHGLAIASVSEEFVMAAISRLDAPDLGIIRRNYHTEKELKSLMERANDEILKVCCALNQYNGPKNRLLTELMGKLQDETIKDLPYEISFPREYRNRTIVQLAEQHAQRGFNFFTLADAVQKATGDSNRYMHVMWARENAAERWADEGIEETAASLAHLEHFKLEA